MVYMPSGTTVPALFFRSHVIVSGVACDERVAPLTASASVVPALARQLTR